jgi:class 3 adenylate cyclase/tetratricopeptide (TPR) repeat protein
MAVLFTDVVSFTRITEQVSREGYYGVEVITGILNRYFDEMNAAITQFDGSLMKYGGDSLLSVFPGPKSSAEVSRDAALNSMRQRLGEINREFEARHGIQLDFREHRAWGPVHLNLVGDPSIHADYYLSGPAIDEIFGLQNEIDSPMNASTTIPVTEDLKFVPDSVSNYLRSSMFNAELRRTVVVFINLIPRHSTGIPLSGYQQYFAGLQRIVHSYGGLVNKIDYTDKGYIVLLTFGLPSSRVDDIERAFVCSRKIQAIPSSVLSSRIGIAEGVVYAGIIGAKERHEYGIIGNGVNISARLMGTAASGDIHVADEILPRISARFETELIDTLAVKGIRDPIRVHRVLREIPNLWAGYERQYTGQVRLSDDLLKSRTESLRNGGIIAIVGESGMGKSMALYHRLKESPGRFELLSADEFDLHRPLHFLNRLLVSRLHIESPAVDPDSLIRYCEVHRIPIDTSLVRAFFGQERELDSAEIDLLGASLVEVLVEFYKGYSRLAVDNFEWIDRHSRMIVLQLVNRLSAAGIVSFVTVHREESLGDLRCDVVHTLAPLTVGDVGQLLHAVYPRMSATVVREIHRLTLGHPRFVTGILRRLQQSVRDTSTTIGIADYTAFVRNGTIADTIESSMFQPFEALSPEEKSVLKYASIIGSQFTATTFSVALRRAILEQATSILHSLRHKDLLTVSELMPDIEYLFQNNLLRERIYQTVPRGEKIRIHNRLGHYFERCFADRIDEFIEVIAHHYIMAENRRLAFRYAYKAGLRAAGIYAFADANFFLNHALRFAEPKRIPAIRLRICENDLHQQRIESIESVWAELDCTQFASRCDRSRYHFVRMRILELHRNYSTLLAYIETHQDEVTDPGYRDRMRIIHADCLRLLNRRTEFRAMANQLMRRYRSGNRSRLLTRLLAVWGDDLLNTGRFDEAAAIYSEMDRITLKNDDRLYRRITLNCLGKMADLHGETKTARDYYEQALSLAEQIGDRLGYMKALNNLALNERARGNRGQAFEILGQCLAITRKVGDSMSENTILYQIGYLYKEDENLPEAERFFTEAATIARKTGDLNGISHAMDALGDCRFMNGDLSGAQAIYLENLELQRQIEDIEGIGHTLGNLGNIEIELGNPEPARGFLRQQRSILHQIGDIIGEGNSWFNEAALDYGQDNLEAALQNVIEAEALFCRVGESDRAELAQTWVEKIRVEIETGIREED